MTGATRELRLIQAVCLVLALGCIVAGYLTAAGERRPASIEFNQ